jgi:hypothetical protein
VRTGGGKSSTAYTGAGHCIAHAEVAVFPVLDPTHTAFTPLSHLIQTCDLCRMVILIGMRLPPPTRLHTAFTLAFTLPAFTPATCAGP